jgi:hypothetical protein
MTCDAFVTGHQDRDAALGTNPLGLVPYVVPGRQNVEEPFRLLESAGLLGTLLCSLEFGGRAYPVIVVVERVLSSLLRITIIVVT